MSTRRLLRRARRRAGGALALGTVVVAVLACQVQPSMADGGAHHDMGSMAAMTACVAALTAIGAAVASVALGVVRLGRWKPVARIVPTRQAVLADVPVAVPRAGPQLLHLICVSRR